MRVAASPASPPPGWADRLSVSDLALLLGFLSGAWAWVRRAQARRQKEHLRAELRDEALLLVMRSLRSTLALVAVRPCMIGNECSEDEDGRPDTQAHAQASVAIDRLDTMSRKMAKALGMPEDE